MELNKSIMTQQAFDGAHFSIAELFLANVKKMMTSNCEIESYAIDTQYLVRETLILAFPGDHKLHIKVERPK